MSFIFLKRRLKPEVPALFLACLAAAFGPTKAGTVQSVTLLDGETSVAEGGVEKARIPGRDFQKAFLSVFFGPRPPMESLKRALLAGPLP